MRGVTAPPAGLAGMQALFARLCTDAALLAAFESDPEGVAERTLGTGSPLADVDVARLHQYAESLRWKRLGEAKRFVPFTLHALGSRYEAEFLHHSRTVIPAGARRPLADAMAFVRGLRRSAADRRTRQAAEYDWLLLNLDFRLAAGRHGAASAHRRRAPWLRLVRLDYEFASIAPHQACKTAWRRRKTLTLLASTAGRSGIWYW